MADALIEGGGAGAFIKKLLRERDMSQREFARQLERPRKNTDDILNGETVLTAATALQIEGLLGVKALYLLNIESAYRLAIERRRLKRGERLPSRRKAPDLVVG